jgi:hypothetical protein
MGLDGPKNPFKRPNIAKDLNKLQSDTWVSNQDAWGCSERKNSSFMTSHAHLLYMISTSPIVTGCRGNNSASCRCSDQFIMLIVKIP